MSLRLTFRSGERGGDTIEIAGESFEIGRDPACDLVLADEKVSRVHARLTQLPR